MRTADIETETDSDVIADAAADAAVAVAAGGAGGGPPSVAETAEAAVAKKTSRSLEADEVLEFAWRFGMPCGDEAAETAASAASAETKRTAPLGPSHEIVGDLRTVILRACGDNDETRALAADMLEAIDFILISESASTSDSSSTDADSTIRFSAEPQDVAYRGFSTTRNAWTSLLGRFLLAFRARMTTERASGAAEADPDADAAETAPFSTVLGVGAWKLVQALFGFAVGIAHQTKTVVTRETADE